MSSLLCPYSLLFFFFFNDTATTEIYTLSLHDALPICDVLLAVGTRQQDFTSGSHALYGHARVLGLNVQPLDAARSEEHTSELQSQSNLVCRLLLEKKKKKNKKIIL